MSFDQALHIFLGLVAVVVVGLELWLGEKVHALVGRIELGAIVLTFVAAVLAVHALVGHFRQSDQAHKEPPANVVEQLHKADRNMSAYCRGGHAWVERNTLSPDGWEVLGSCPREEVMR